MHLKENSTFLEPKSANLMKFILARDRETQRHTFRHNPASTPFPSETTPGSASTFCGLCQRPLLFSLLVLRDHREESLDQGSRASMWTTWKRKRTWGSSLGWPLGRPASPLRTFKEGRRGILLVLELGCTVCVSEEAGAMGEGASRSLLPWEGRWWAIEIGI